MQTVMRTEFALLAVAGFASLALAGISVETYGTAAPPPTVAGTYFMWPAGFRSDFFTDVTETDGGGFNQIEFSTPVSVRAIDHGWISWSHGYTGNVFYTNGATSLTMTMGLDFRAFRFYAEPNPFAVFNMTATGSDGSASITSIQAVDGAAGGSGAAGWGFYATGSSAVQSVRVFADVDFGVGEFATGWFPAPASLGLFALGGLIAGRRR